MIKPKLIMGMPRPANPGEMVGIDTEFFGMNPKKLHRPHGKFACATFAYDDGSVYMITDEHDIRESLERVDSGKWVLQNAAFDIRQLRRWAEIQPRRIWDTQLVEQGLFGGYYSLFNLGVMSARWLGQPLDKEARDAFGEANEMTPDMRKYASIDPLATLKIAQAQIQYIADEQLSIKHYWEADHPAMWASLDMLPAKVDVANWSKFATEMEKEAAKIEKNFNFNPRSPAQVKKILEATLNVRLKSTDADTLEGLLEDYPDNQLIRDIMDYRTYSKMSSTYGNGWLEQHVEGDGYVYSHWKIVGALTGRMASGDPYRLGAAVQ